MDPEMLINENDPSQIEKTNKHKTRPIVGSVSCREIMLAALGVSTCLDGSWSESTGGGFTLETNWDCSGTYVLL